MGDHSAIEWTDASWNPVTGCTRVSPGCDNCYAAREAATRLKNTPQYQGLAVVTPSGRAAFNGTVRLLPERLEEPLRWRRPRRVFVNSMSDLFHEQIPDEFIDQVFAVMALAGRHTFQILSKRPERMLAYASDLNRRGQISAACEFFAYENVDRRVVPGWPVPNVWLGVSVEYQQRADERIPLLLQTPAAVRFISAEPLLGPIDLRQARAIPNGDLRWGGPLCDDPACKRRSNHYPGEFGCRGSQVDRGGAPGALDWVIVGGESGPGARPMDVAWARSIVAQCKAADVPVFVKQDSGPRPGKQGRIPDDLWIKEWPRGARS